MDPTVRDVEELVKSENYLGVECKK